jgi:hypothetical protein
MQIVFVEPALPGDIIVVARKVEDAPQNEPFLDDEAPYLKSSPFISDYILHH